MGRGRKGAGGGEEEELEEEEEEEEEEEQEEGCLEETQRFGSVFTVETVLPLRFCTGR